MFAVASHSRFASDMHRFGRFMNKAAQRSRKSLEHRKFDQAASLDIYIPNHAEDVNLPAPVYKHHDMKQAIQDHRSSNHTIHFHADV